MISALVYLQLTGLKNLLREKLKRLKHPRYLLGFIAGLAYFYFFLFRHTIGKGNPHAARQIEGVLRGASEWMAQAEPLAALIVLCVVSLAWILPHSRGALSFSEAEIAFLFPAPLTRTTLIHFKLVKSQLGILITALIFSLFSQRAAFLDGPSWAHLMGWWLLFLTINLHFYAASFTHSRLLDLGVRPWLKQLVSIAIFLSIFVFAIAWAVRALPPALPGQEYDLLPWVKTILAAPVLSWILLPFRIAVRPFFAADAAAFWLALGPALLLAVLHYVWVIRSQVAFEEASLADSQKRAELVTRLRRGGHVIGKQKTRRAPFTLAPKGPVIVAFLWKGLLSFGRWGSPRAWVIVGVIVYAGLHFVLRDPSLRVVRVMIFGMSTTLVAMMLLLLPMMSQRGIPQLMQRMDFVKAFPLRGWQVVLGEMLTPVLLCSALEWGLLAVVHACGLPGQKAPAVLAMLVGPGTLGVAALVPFVLAIVLTLPFGAALTFPAWVAAASHPGAGIELMGQRLLFSAAYMLTLLFSLLPAALLGSLPYLIVYLLSESHLAAFYSAVAVAILVLAAELAAILWWLGRRYERFDLSLEAPR